MRFQFAISHFLAFLPSVFLVTVFLGLAFGQSDRGTITGTVADPAGAVLANTPARRRNL